MTPQRWNISPRATAVKMVEACDSDGQLVDVLAFAIERERRVVWYAALVGLAIGAVAASVAWAVLS